MMNGQIAKSKGKLNVLIVDDEPVQLMSIRRGLRTRGFATSEAASVDEALCKLTADDTIDLLITDYAMPCRNGLDLLRTLRESNPGLPVLMMTAHGEKDLALESLAQGCASYLEKPFTLEALLRVISEVMVKRENSAHAQA